MHFMYHINYYSPTVLVKWLEPMTIWPILLVQLLFMRNISKEIQCIMYYMHRAYDKLYCQSVSTCSYLSSHSQILCGHRDI